MKSLMTFAGILAFNFLNTAHSAEFSCPISQAFSQYTCSGTLRVQNMAQLMAYKSNLGTTTTNPTVAKDLLIDFNLNLTEDLNISSPCAIKTTTNITINSSANICLNSKNAVVLEEGLTFTGKNLKLEGSEQVFIGKNSNINAQNITLLSKGNGDLNQAYIRDNATINAANITIESLNKGFIGANSNVHLTGAFTVYSKGDADATVRGGARVEAAKIDIQSSNVTTIANLATMIAPEIKLIGTNGCNVSKGASITATDRIGNCFLTSLTQQKFSIDKNRGNAPLTVSFNASTITDNVTAYLWTFGDGQTLTTTVPTVNHTYAAAGSYTASLMFATLPNEKGQKSAGELRIDVQAAPVVPTTPPRGTFNYAQDGTFVYLKAFIRRTQFDIAKAYYVIDGNQNNKINIDNFYQNAQTTVEMNNFGIHNVVMYVEDTAGQKFNTALSIDIKQDENQIAPFIRFYGEQSAVRTAFINMTQSFIPIPNEYIKDFKVEFGDGQVAMIERATSVVHTYAQAGTYNVKVSGTYNGITRSNTQAVTVTNNNLPALNPVAAFEYLSFDFAGNVRFTDDRSATPNGEIISYEWDFGDGLGKEYGQQASRFFSPGEYLVTLKVTDTAGKIGSQSQKIKITEIGGSLVASLNCWKEEEKNVGCDIFALDQNEQITRIKISWGDGDTNLLTNPEVTEWGLFFSEHLYLNNGEYTIKLVVNTRDGRQKEIFQNINLSSNTNLPPISSLQCTNQEMDVSCNSFGSYDPEGSSLTYIYDWGDGEQTYTVIDVSSHKYQNPGLYNISLTVRDNLNQSTIAKYSVQIIKPINLPPVADGYCNSFVPEIISCFSNSIDPDMSGPFLTEWSVDNVFSTETIFSTRVNGSGIKIVKLTITDFFGAQTIKFFPVTVLENKIPIVLAECEEVNEDKILCTSNSFDSDGVIKSTKWILGDGRTFSGSSFIINRDELESLNYTLEVEDNLGAVNAIQNSIIIRNLKAAKAVVPDAVCPISDFLKDKDCSPEYYEATNLSDVLSYVSEGKFDLDGRLLNLRINKSINSGRLNISTVCNIELGTNTNFQINNNDICLRGENIKIKEQSSVEIIGKGNINIIAENNIELANTVLTTSNDINMLLLNMFKFNDGIIINNSNINSGALKINSASYFSVDESSEILSNVIIVNSKDCNSNNMISNIDCGFNNIPEDVEIFTDVKMDKSVDVSAVGIDEDNYNLSWEVDGKYYENKNEVINIPFEIAGQVSISLVVENKNGFYKKFKKSVNISPRQMINGQTLALRLNSNDDLIIAFLNNVQVELIRSPVLPKVFILKNSNYLNGVNNLQIPNLGISIAFNSITQDLPSDANLFLNNFVNSMESKINTVNIYDNSPVVSTVLLNLHSKFNQLSLEEKEQVAKYLYVNKLSDTDYYTSSILKKYNVNISDLFFPTANAGVIDDAIVLTKTIVEICSSFGAAQSVIGAKYTLIAALGIYGSWKFEGKERAAIQAATAAVIFLALIKDALSFEEESKKIYKFDSKKFDVYQINTGKNITLNIRGSLDSVNLSKDIKHPGYSIVSAVQAANKYNLMINSIYNLMPDVSSELKEKGFKIVEFPTDTPIGFISTEDIEKVEILNPESGVSITNISKNGKDLILNFQANESKTVKIKINYKNYLLGVFGSIEKEVQIAIDKPSYALNNRVASFYQYVPESYKIEWDFGDGVVTMKDTSNVDHKYEDEGNYKVKTKLFDDHMNLVTTNEIDVSVVDRTMMTITFYSYNLYLMPSYMQPTSVKGFSGQYKFKNQGTCYTKQPYRVGDGTALDFYNCSNYEPILP